MKKTTGLFLAALALVSFAFMKPEPRQINVVIDAGHGGHDFGAQHEAYIEKDIAEKVTQKILAMNKNANVVIHLTRNGDEFIPLADRAEISNKIKPDLLLSLHVNHNKANSSASGMEFYISKENPQYEKSMTIAQKLSDKFVKENGMKSRGIKLAPYMILKKTETPAVLVELGFLSNDQDRKYLIDDNQQNRIAGTIVEFISELE